MMVLQLLVPCNQFVMIHDAKLSCPSYTVGYVSKNQINRVRSIAYSNRYLNDSGGLSLSFVGKERSSGRSFIWIVDNMKVRTARIKEG